MAEDEGGKWVHQEEQSSTGNRAGISPGAMYPGRYLGWRSAAADGCWLLVGDKWGQAHGERGGRKRWTGTGGSRY